MNRFLVALLLGALSLSSHAELIDRGGGLIYDTVLDITWTQDADINGSANWNDQVAWADGLVINDPIRGTVWDDWRLPSADVDGNEVVVDCSTATEAECRDHEFGYLFYQYGISSSTPGLFTNVQSFFYWSGTEGPSDPTNLAYCFDMEVGNGTGGESPKAGLCDSWAVRDGDVGLPVSAPDGLLGVAPGFPQVDATGTTGQGCTYDSSTKTLTITSTPNFYFSDANTLTSITGGLLTISATVFNDGTISSGTLTINGTDGALTDPLLTAGTPATYGIEDSSPLPSATDRADFMMTPTGGSILSDPNWPTGAMVGASVTLEGSTYSGSMNEDWVCDRAKLIVGPVEQPAESNIAAIITLINLLLLDN